MNRFEADELLNSAIMEKIPYIVVEGVDDIHIYEEIAKSAGLVCEVYSVEMIEGLAGGNDGVIEAMNLIESLPMSEDKSAGQYVMGVIDSDARYFRNEMPALNSIFRLNLYSIESHFVSISSIKPTINRVTRISSKESIDADAIYSAIEKNIFDVFYFSLDALKNAINPGYKSVVGFSSNPGRRKDLNTISQLNDRKIDLDEFASCFSLKPNVESYRKFVKGKWLLVAFSESLYEEISNLVGKCKCSEIEQCTMCRINNSAPCLFRLREGMNKNTLQSIIKDFVDTPDFDYIREAFRSLSESAAS